MPLLEEIKTETSTHLAFHCPGCNHPHSFQIENSIGPVWEWDGDLIKPTFSPSLRQRQMVDGKLQTSCHLIVTNGRIRFCNDCTHKLVGQTVDMEPVE